MKWITRERPKIDRIACPWLIARFVEQGMIVYDALYAWCADTPMAKTGRFVRQWLT